jgi:flavin-binding protein dodecin
MKKERPKKELVGSSEVSLNAALQDALATSQAIDNHPSELEVVETYSVSDALKTNYKIKLKAIEKESK